MPRPTCPDISRLRALLDDTLPEDAGHALGEHVETCTACRQTLEQIISAGGAGISTARLLNANKADHEAALRSVIERLIVAADGAVPPRENAHPSRIGHYEIQETIGQGGMGVVFRAWDEKLRRTVAIKVLAPYLAAGAAARSRFMREAQAAAGIRDPHVVTVHAIDEAGDVPYLVMEHVSGESLQQRLDRDGPLEMRDVVRIGMQAAAGLAAAHARGLIHRDIKPANILLEHGNGPAKVTDFGLARAVDDGSLSNLGVVAGTPQYMAPEQARGEPVDHRSDLFSLGSVLYAMCCGLAPYGDGSALATVRRICDEAPRPIQELNPNVPAWLAKLIARLQAKDQADRFQSASEVADLLGKHLADPAHPAATIVAAGASGEPAGAVHRHRAKSSKTLLAIAAGAATVIAGVLFIGPRPGGQDKPPLPDRTSQSKDVPVLSPAAKRTPRVLFILPSRDFISAEFWHVMDPLKEAGIETAVATSTGAVAQSGPHETGPHVAPDLRLAEVRVADFDAVVVCGGLGAIAEYAGDAPHAAEARRVITEAVAANRCVAAVGTGPVVLAEAGVLRGVRATCAPWGGGIYNQRLKDAGAEWVDEPFVVSGSIITARNYQSGHECGWVLLRQLRNRP